MRIEANAVLKFAPVEVPEGYESYESYLYITGYTPVYVEGTPYNYAYFTSGYDDSVGVDTTGPGLPLPDGQSPGPADYRAAIWAENVYGAQVQYGKFAYAADAILATDTWRVSGGYSQIRHCIFRDNITGVSVGCNNAYYDEETDQYYYSCYVDVFNSLFDGPESILGAGIFFGSTNDAPRTLLAVNCTFEHFLAGVYINDANIRAWYGVFVNIFSRSNCGLYTEMFIPGPDSTYDISYNGLYALDEDDYTSASEGSERPPYSTQYWEDTSYPFAANANGSFYLRANSPFRDKGPWSAAGLSGKSTTAATTATGRIKTADITASETWTRFEDALDSSTVDLGYHYEPVDYIVDPTSVLATSTKVLKVQGTTTTLWILPGVIVAFSADTTNSAGTNISRNNRLYAAEGGSIDARGTGPQPITFTSTAASGDRIGHPANDGTFNWYGSAIHLAGIGTTPGPKAQIAYCNFSWAGIGVTVEAWPYSPPILDVNNCRFSYGFDGLFVNPTVQSYNPTTPVLVRNNLFHHLDQDGVVTLPPTLDDRVLVENCTFDVVARGVYLQSPATIRNCLFTPNRSEAIAVAQGVAYSADHNYGDGQPGDPKLDPGNPPAPDIGTRYYLNQSLSPCIDAGHPRVECYQSTARDARWDTHTVDIGYHYPVRGQLHVAPNFFFEFENGESFYPISASNMPLALEDTSPVPHAAFYPTTVPLYLKTLAEHGVNMMRVYIFVGSTHTLSQEGADFRQQAVQEFDKYFDALDKQGLYYSVVPYDGTDMLWCHEGTYDPMCIYYETNGGTVPDEATGWFFKADGSNDNLSTRTRTARTDFAHSLDQFLEGQYANPKWYTRKNLIGWDVFSELDTGEKWLLWYDGYDWINPDWRIPIERETTTADWATTMMLHIQTREETLLGLGRRRLHWVDPGNLRRFNWWDPDRGASQSRQAAYLDLPQNDQIDYHLYTWLGTDQALWFTEKPSDPFTPMKFYLGVDVGLSGDLGTSGCTLPEIIDHNRYYPPNSPHRLGGFCASELGLEGWGFGVPKRLINDCYHNYLWLVHATGSVGGPTPWKPRGGLQPDKGYYDLSGVTYLNPFGEPLNGYTEE